MNAKCSRWFLSLARNPRGLFRHSHSQAFDIPNCFHKNNSLFNYFLIARPKRANATLAEKIPFFASAETMILHWLLIAFCFMFPEAKSLAVHLARSWLLRSRKVETREKENLLFVIKPLINGAVHEFKHKNLVHRSSFHSNCDQSISIRLSEPACRYHQRWVNNSLAHSRLFTTKIVIKFHERIFLTTFLLFNSNSPFVVERLKEENFTI